MQSEDALALERTRMADTRDLGDKTRTHDNTGNLTRMLSCSNSGSTTKKSLPPSISTKSEDNTGDDTPAKKLREVTIYNDSKTSLTNAPHKTICMIREIIASAGYAFNQDELGITRNDAQIVQEFVSDHKDDLNKIVHVNEPVTEEEKEITRKYLTHFIDEKYEAWHYNSLLKNQILRASNFDSKFRQKLYRNRFKFKKPPNVQNFVKKYESLEVDNADLNKEVNKQRDIVDQVKKIREIERTNYESKVVDLQEKHDAVVADQRKEHNLNLGTTKDNLQMVIESNKMVIDSQGVIIQSKDNEIRYLKEKLGM